MTLAISARAAPEFLTALQFWRYLLTLGQTEETILAGIDALEASAALAPADAAGLRVTVRKAVRFERADPALLAMAQALGLAADQAALDAHFRAARALS